MGLQRVANNGYCHNRRRQADQKFYGTYQQKKSAKIDFNEDIQAIPSDKFSAQNLSTSLNN